MKKILFPNAIDMVRLINDNAVDNLLAAKTSYAKLPSLYQRAYLAVHRTGAVSFEDRFEAPNLALTDPAATQTPRLRS